jgi:hypothetical protein
VVVPRCRTPHHKTHSTAASEEIAIAYSWHPWAGRTVRIHEVIVFRRSPHDVGHGCLLSNSACNKADGSIVGPCSIASPALGSEAAWGNGGAIRCKDSISRFLLWRSPCSSVVAGSDHHSTNSTFVC